jgi:hypothetical protein
VTVTVSIPAPNPRVRQRRHPIIAIPTNPRAPGVRCTLAASCRQGMLLAVEDAGATTWEVVRFGPPHALLLGVFAHGNDAMALYSAEVKGEPT